MERMHARDPDLPVVILTANADPDVEAEARALLPLVEALDRGDTSERKLAQMSGIWVVMIE